MDLVYWIDQWTGLDGLMSGLGVLDRSVDWIGWIDEWICVLYRSVDWIGWIDEWIGCIG